MRYMHMSLRDAYSLCKRNRPICFPNLGFWTQLISYEYQLRKENSVKSKILSIEKLNFSIYESPSGDNTIRSCSGHCF